jgi:hypothetical protein
MKSRKLLGVTALFYTDKKYLREWDRLWGGFIITDSRRYFLFGPNSCI